MNEAKINRLLEYTLTFPQYAENTPDETFTADSYIFDPSSTSVKFYRTGNLIREYFNRPNKIVATPVDNGG